MSCGTAQDDENPAMPRMYKLSTSSEASPLTTVALAQSRRRQPSPASGAPLRPSFRSATTGIAGEYIGPYSPTLPDLLRCSACFLDTFNGKFKHGMTPALRRSRHGSDRDQRIGKRDKRKRSSILVAFSGGPASLCVLFLGS
jgi:hypothetical protein